MSREEGGGGSVGRSVGRGLVGRVGSAGGVVTWLAAAEALAAADLRDPARELLGQQHDPHRHVGVGHNHLRHGSGVRYSPSTVASYRQQQHLPSAPPLPHAATTASPTQPLPSHHRRRLTPLWLSARTSSGSTSIVCIMQSVTTLPSTRVSERHAVLALYVSVQDDCHANGGGASAESPRACTVWELCALGGAFAWGVAGRGGAARSQGHGNVSVADGPHG